MEFNGCGLLFRIVLCERPEVVEALKYAAGLLHGSHVQLIFNPPHVALSERRSAPADLVDVGTRDRMMSCMEFRLGLHQVHHIDVGRKHIVDLHLQNVRCQHRWRLEVGHLIECVHTGVGSARPHELEISVPECVCNGSDELALNSARILLYLPAGIARTFVFDRKLESCHA